MRKRCIHCGTQVETYPTHKKVYCSECKKKLYSILGNRFIRARKRNAKNNSTTSNISIILMGVFEQLCLRAIGMIFHPSFCALLYLAASTTVFNLAFGPIGEIAKLHMHIIDMGLGLFIFVLYMTRSGSISLMLFIIYFMHHRWVYVERFTIWVDFLESKITIFQLMSYINGTSYHF